MAIIIFVVALSLVFIPEYFEMDKKEIPLFIGSAIIGISGMWFGYNQFLVNNRLVALEESDRQPFFIVKNIEDCNIDERLTLTNIGSGRARSVSVAIGGSTLADKLNILQTPFSVVLGNNSITLAKGINTKTSSIEGENNDYYSRLTIKLKKEIDEVRKEAHRNEQWVLLSYLDHEGLERVQPVDLQSGGEPCDLNPESNAGW